MIGGQTSTLRKAELERLSSPEQLDTAMRVTSPAGWVALVALGTLIAAVVVWSITADLPELVDGNGMLLRGEDVKTVQASAPGRVEEILVKVGDPVTAGQVVARLSLPQLQGEIESIEARIRDLQAQQSTWARRMRDRRANLEVQKRSYQEQLRNKQDLVKRGLARRQDVLAIESQIAQIDGQILDTRSRDDDTEMQLAEQQRERQKLADQLVEQSVVKSAADGNVSAILVAENQLIEGGSRVLNLEGAQDTPFQVLLYVAFADGKKIDKDMTVRISPSTVKAEEYGYILGTITNVSRSPVTPEEIRIRLNNDRLAQKFAEDTPFEVEAKPIVKDGRFEWTSAKGATINIDSNTPCSGQVITATRKPISYVIPKVKEVFGLT